MAVPQRKVKLTVVNDLICPNCCIGQHELLSAISYCHNVLHLPLSFDIEFLPFRLISTACLNEDMPKVERSVFFSNKLGQDNYTALVSAIGKWGSEKGIPLSFKGVMSQTTRAHRLSRKAYLVGGKDLQLPLLCGLYKAHLEEGKDIADFEVLADIAQRVGLMSHDKAVEFLTSNELEDEVNRLCDEAKQKGISGVPLTIIDGRWAVSGGQSSEVFIQIFRKLAEAGQAPVFTPQNDIVHQPMNTVC